MADYKKITTDIVLKGEFIMSFKYKDIDVTVWHYNNKYICFDNSDPDCKEADIYELDYKDIVCIHAMFCNKQIRIGGF